VTKPSAKQAYTAIVVLSVLAAVLSLQLLVHHLEHRLGLVTGKSFCSVNEFFDCDKVATSKYSEFLGIPVASYGLFFFLSTLLILKSLKNDKEESSTWSLLKILSIIGIIPVVILASISVILIRSVCLVCFASYLCMIGFAAISFRMNLADKNFISDGIKKLCSILRSNKLLLVSICAVIFVVMILPGVGIYRHRANLKVSLEDTNEAKAINNWNSDNGHLLALSLMTEGTDRDVIFGDVKSNVSIVSYSDMACPYCKTVSSVLHDLVQKYPVKLIFKDYPLDQHCNPAITRPFHIYSCKAAKIGRCALQTNEQFFEKIHIKLYSLDPVTDESLELLASEVSVASEQSKICLESDQLPGSIRRHINEGNEIKLQGTPSIYINGKLVTDPTAKTLESIVKLALGVK
jgi:protein-disulfide isomerase/uncharacterized membrane protein